MHHMRQGQEKMTKYGGTPQGVWDVAARRDPLGPDNPALSFPSEYWSEV